MELSDFAARVEHRAHLAYLFFEIVDIRLALVVVKRDDRRAATKPAKRFAERDVTIEREIALSAVVLENSLSEVGPCQSIGKFGGRRVRCVTRTGDVVFLDEVEVDFEHTHLKLLTVLTRLSMFPSLALGGTP